MRIHLIGFDFGSRFSWPLASRSNCTVFCHQPTFSPFGQSFFGRSGFTFATISDAVMPGAFFGVTSKMAAFIASYFSASTFEVRPGTLTFEISTFVTDEIVWNLLDTVNPSS